MRHLLLIVLLFPFAAFSEQSAEVVISTGEYPPFISAHIEDNGLVGTIIREAFASQNIAVKYQFMPWKRAFLVSEQGKVDATAYWYESETRSKTHYYSKPIIQESVVWFHQYNIDFDWNTIEDLSRYQIVAIDGYTYKKEFWDYVKQKKLNIELVTSTQQAVEMMLMGRADVMLENLDVANYIIKKNNYIKGLTHHPKAYINAHSHLLLNKENQRSQYLLALFNRGIRKIKDNKTYQSIFNIYREEKQKKLR